MINAFETINVHMSLKIHFHHSHVDKLAAQLSTESDEHGEKFHQVSVPIEDRYKGKELTSMLGELCWHLCEDSDIAIAERGVERYRKELKKPLSKHGFFWLLP